ncbi:MAG: class I SAM-dependent methyltransferase [Chitinophagaceae bacterium]
MSTLQEIFETHNGRLLHKWNHYFEVYERYFAAYRGKPVNILEIGISHGGSLQLWRKYFGDQANIYAVDINPECKQFEEEKTNIFIGSQEDPVFLDELKTKLPLLDILIDDGGHTMKQQIVTFNHLFTSVKDGGIYLVEDTHTSYWRAFHGGYKKRRSFIEFAKHKVDEMHAWHINNEKILPVSAVTENITGISFYDSIVVFEKKKRQEPSHSMRGNSTITAYMDPTLKKESLFAQIRKKIRGDKKDSYSKQLK